jgi:hypothetical protein
MKSSRLIFPAFLLITLITYLPTIGAGFVYDFVGWQRVYNLGSFSDIWHCFGYKGNHQVLHFFFYSIYSVFHIQGLPWYIIFCSLHAFNGWLLYKWLLQIKSKWKIQLPALLAAGWCVLFLIHPYNVEPVVWKVCIHYLLSMSAVLGILLVLPKYIYSDYRNALWVVLLLYTLSLFLLEISFITPTLITVLLAIEAFAFSSDKGIIRRSILIASSMWGLLAGYIVLNKMTIGTLVGHYGSQAHLKMDIIGMMSVEVKYLVKHIFDARFFSFKTKSFLFDTILSSPELTFFILLLCLSVTILYLIRIKKTAPRWHLVFFSTVASMLYVLPISNLYFLHLHVGMNDRYSYLPLAFLILTGLLLLYSLPKWISWSFTILVLMLNFYFQQKTIRYWKESTEVLQHLKDTYRWNDASHVFILNSPDNLNGIVMASIWGEPSGIDELIDQQTPKPNTGIMFDIFQYNMTTPKDGVKVEQTGPMQLKVTFHQWGNWWHRDGIGASSYENEYYKAEILDYPYQVTFKQFPEGSVILYQDGPEWKEFKLDIGQ